MEKHIIKWSYWLGVLSALLTLLTRALNILGLPSLVATRGNSIAYNSFLHAAELFFPDGDCHRQLRLVQLTKIPRLGW